MADLLDFAEGWSMTKALSLAEEVAAMNARTLGRNVRFGAGKRGQGNPFPEETFHAYCWSAGYNQNTRNVIELYRDWETQHGKTR